MKQNGCRLSPDLSDDHFDEPSFKTRAAIFNKIKDEQSISGSEVANRVVKFTLFSTETHNKF